MSQSELKTFAYAKINLSLAVSAKREDRYHDLQSVMQSIELHDVVEIRRSGQGITCHCGSLSGPFNLAYKAAELFLKHLGKNEGIEITITKAIPVQAGLAGGSTDAAAVLRLLNELYDQPLAIEELKTLAGQCGADVPFCVEGGTAWATGRGEKLEQMPPVPVLDIILAKPKPGVNTAEAYRIFDMLSSGTVLDKIIWEKTLTGGDSKQIARLLTNDLEQASFRLVPEIELIKDELLNAGCLGALMAGSGSSVFGIAKGQEHAQQIAQQLKEKGISQVWITRSVGRY